METPTTQELKLNDNIQRTAEFISSFEGFRSEAYWDVKQWSIGYGTKSYKGEVITHDEAVRRKMIIVEDLYSIVDTECFNNDQKTALTSYIYNTGGNQMSLRHYIKICDKKSILYIMNVWGWNLPGLVKRRVKETNLFKI